MPGKLDSLGLVESLRRRMVDFASADLYVTDPDIQRAARAAWKDEASGLVGELWVEGTMPPMPGQRLQTIAGAGGFDQDLLGRLMESGAWGDWRLHEHQERAIRAASDDPGGAVMVSAGTGAGKTESFLLPLVDRLWSAPRGGPGMRALILYPMNALVRDQMDRLDAWLGGQSRLSYFHFTSETPETESEADRRGIAKQFASRVRSRDEARRAPPDICVTNYSMLEYMLARPQDALFFGEGLEVVVLDEAHLYTGTLASEIMFLLRRVLLRCGLTATDVLHLATSATLGGDDDELRAFLSQLTATPPDRARVIRGRPQPSAPLPASGSDQSVGALVELDGSLPPDAGAADVLSILGKETGDDSTAPIVVGRLLADWPATERLRSALHAEPGVPHLLGELAEKVWPHGGQSSVAATVALLRWTSMAQSGPDAPLLAHRLHLPLRGPAGLGLCLNGDCSGPEQQKKTRCGAVQDTRGDRCRWCSSVVLPIARCESCGLAVLTARQEHARFVPEPVPSRATRRTVLEARGLLLGFSDPALGAVEVLPDGSVGEGGVRLRPLPPLDADAPHETGCAHESFEPLASGAGLLLSVIAETSLAAMPPDSDPDRAGTRPAGGRRLLVFSDSRREAARLGPALTWGHEVQLVRAEILRLMDAASADDTAAAREYLESDIARLQDLLEQDPPPSRRQLIERDLGERVSDLRAHTLGGPMRDWERALAASDTLAEILSFDGASIHRRAEWSDESWSENHRANGRRARALLAREFVSPPGRSAGASLEALGLALVDYPELRELPPPTLGQLPSAIRERAVEQWPQFVAALLDSLRVDGGITTGERELDDDYSEDHAPIGKWISFEGPDRRDRAQFRGATSRHRRNAFLRQLLLDFGATGEQLDEFEPLLARAAFDWLRTAEPRPEWLEHHQTDAWFRVRFPDLALRRPDEVWLDGSGLIVGSVVNGRHPRGTGRFVQRTQSELDADPRFQRLRSELREEPSLRVGLWAEEHSAQLSPEEARRIQDLFESGVRNVLSSSTTMELGVDIGGLSGVLMTNTPPSRARYLQRAGRAGRRGEGASVTLLFARNRPFDQEVFRNFAQYLSAPMRAPSVLLERDRLALRHAYSHVLGSFFRALWEPGQSTSTMGAFRQMGDFTGSPSTTRWRSGLKPGISDQPHPPDPASPPAWWTADGRPLEAQFRRYIEHLAGHPGGIAADLRTILSNARAEERLDDWPRFCEELLDRFDESTTAWRGEFDEFLAAWDLAAAGPLANFLHFQLTELRERPVIAHLAEQQFLPRFGFPLGVLQLRIDTGRTDGDSWALDRSGALALREYAPGAKVLAGGRQITSRGLVKHWVGEDEQALGAQRRLLTCSEEHSYLSTGVALHDECPYCGAAPSGSGNQVIRVARGFKTAAWDPPRRARGTELVGTIEVVPPAIGHAMSGERTDVEIESVPGLRATHLEGAQLITLNAGEHGFGFHICYRCGYADSELTRAATGAQNLPTAARDHSPLWMRRRGHACWTQGALSSFARNRVLLHEETTDALVLDFRGWGVDLRAERGALLAWAAGLPHAIGQTLDLDAGDVAAAPYPFSDGVGIILHDTAAGGAGHVSELLRGSVARDVLEALRARLYVDDAHNARCIQGCLSCVLSYGAQHLVGVGLDRPRGLALLDALLSGGGVTVPEPMPVPADGSPAPQRDAEERVARAAARRRGRSRRRSAG